jgi:hypothetical protein
MQHTPNFKYSGLRDHIKPSAAFIAGCTVQSSRLFTFVYSFAH